MLEQSELELRYADTSKSLLAECLVLLCLSDMLLSLQTKSMFAAWEFAYHLCWCESFTIVHVGDSPRQWFRYSLTSLVTWIPFVLIVVSYYYSNKIFTSAYLHFFVLEHFIRFQYVLLCTWKPPHQSMGPSLDFPSAAMSFLPLQAL